jgi:hypothetical protein
VIRDETAARPHERNMPFINIAERVGMQKGLLRGIEKCLKIRFGADGLELMPELRQIQDHEMLEKILDKIDVADSPDDLRRVWTRKRRSKTVKPE